MTSTQARKEFTDRDFGTNTVFSNEPQDNYVGGWADGASHFAWFERNDNVRLKLAVTNLDSKPTLHIAEIYTEDMYYGNTMVNRALRCLRLQNVRLNAVTFHAICHEPTRQAMICQLPNWNVTLVRTAERILGIGKGQGKVTMQSEFKTLTVTRR